MTALVVGLIIVWGLVLFAVFWVIIQALRLCWWLLTLPFRR